MLGEEVVPVLRREFAKGRPADVPDAPTHASLLAAREAKPEAEPEAGREAERAPSAETAA